MEAQGQKICQSLKRKPQGKQTVHLETVARGREQRREEKKASLCEISWHEGLPPYGGDASIRERTMKPKSLEV